MHRAGDACLSCHRSGGSAPAWLYGGTVYSGSAGVAHVQVGIKDGSNFYSSYSADNGNIWLPASAGSVNWATAEIRIRGSAGEAIMPGHGNGDCNTCHGSSNRITAP